MERSCGIAHRRSRGRVEGRWAAVGQPTAAIEAGRGERGRGEGGPPVTRNCILPACITCQPTTAMGYIVLLPVRYLRDPSPTAPHSTSAGASTHRT